MSKRRPFWSWVTRHKKVISWVSAAVVFLLGQGALFQWMAWKAASVKAEEDRVALESEIMGKLHEYESSIHQLIPVYLEKRDRLPDQSAPQQVAEYNNVRYQLTGLFVSYNRLEAKLSRLEKRGAQFFFPSELLPPRAPGLTMGSASNDPTRIVLQIHPKRDEVVDAVTTQLVLSFDEYDVLFRDSYLLRACKAGGGEFCTRLADLRSGSGDNATIAAEDRVLYDKGCALGDHLGCVRLAFDTFKQQDYITAERWLQKGCDLSGGLACGFLGSLYASKLLGERKSPERARVNLEKGCEMNDSRSCYYLALLFVSGLVDRNEQAARFRLDAACTQGLQEACRSIKQFDEFKACSPDAFHTPAGDGATLTIECNEPNEVTQIAPVVPVKGLKH